MMLLTILIACAIHRGSSSVSQPPNIIFILADDLGWDDVGFHGSKQIPTPNMDVLAYDGVILNNYYVQPICTPSRAALLTGKHPIHLGLQSGVIMGSEPYGLGLEEKLLPQYLKELGYATHMVGKWHIGYMSKEYTPTYRGFESHYGYYGGCDDYWDHTYQHNHNNKSYWGLDFFNNLEPEKTAFGQYSTQVFTQKTEEIINNHNKSKPLFLYLPHQAPHNANAYDAQEAPWKYIEKFGHIENEHRRKYAAMVAGLDDSIGNVTKALAARGMLTNTIIAFSTDNGGPEEGFSANYACNYPLRGMKYTLWEGGVRGNGFLWSPLLKHHGYVSRHMMSIYDWLPTLLHAAGYDPSKIPTIDGLNLWPALSENAKRSPREEILHNIDAREEHNYAFRKGHMKVKFGSDAGNDGWFSPDKYENKNTTTTRLQHFEKISRGEFYQSNSYYAIKSIGRDVKRGTPVNIKCGMKPANASINCKPKEIPCLFNITVDPCEYHNLADLFPDVLVDLIARVDVYNATAMPSKNKPLDTRGLPIYHQGVWMPWLNLTQALDIESL